ncbi:MAG: metallophosphoesterase [Marinifilaceae bacterium]
MSKELKILHIADLHYTNFKDDIYSWFEMEKSFEVKFIDSIKKALDSKLDYIIIAGDLSNDGDEDEFKKILVFLNKLSLELKVDKENFIIVPGNHDINWLDNENAFDIKNVDIRAKDKKASKIENSEAYKFHDEKFSQFSKFYKEFNGFVFKSKESLFDVKTAIVGDDEIQLLSFNSNYKESNFGPHVGYIDYDTFESNLVIDKKDTPKIAIMHHNISKHVANESEVKYSFSQNNIKTFIFGHQHSNQGDTLSNVEGRTNLISAGTLGKKHHEVDNCFNILTILKDDLELKIKQEFYQYIETSREYNWHNLTDKNYTYIIPQEKKDEISSVLSKDIVIDDVPVQPMDTENVTKSPIITHYSELLVSIVSKDKLFCSGHFHWNEKIRTLGLLKTFSLLCKRDSSAIAKKSIEELIIDNNINSELFVGLGIEGNILGSYLGSRFDGRYTFIPYSVRDHNHDTVEVDLNLKGIKSICFITDVIHSGTSIKSIFESYNILKDIKVTVVSLFYVNEEIQYSDSVIQVDGYDIKYYCVCDDIKISKCNCKSENDCNLMKNKLVDVNVLYEKKEQTSVFKF